MLLAVLETSLVRVWAHVGAHGCEHGYVLCELDLVHL